MSGDDKLIELLHASLLGEVRGEMFFAMLRDAAVDEAWAATLETLRALEERTAACITGCLERIGGALPSFDGCESDARSHAAAVAAMSPAALAVHLASRRPAFIEIYRRIGVLLPEAERWVADELVDHTRTTESLLGG